MIPKIIHYCWLSKDEYPQSVIGCINSWEKLFPDYEIKLWDANSFDFNSIPYVKEAFDHKQWAFVSDYIRLYALYTEGRVYLDSDVQAYKRFDEWHKYDLFTGIETWNKQHDGFRIEAAILGARSGNQMIRECMKYYESTPFINEDGTMNRTPAPEIITPVFMKHYGWKPSEGTVLLPGNVIVFGSDKITNSWYPLLPTVVLYHRNNCSWYKRGPLYRFCKRLGIMSLYHQLEKIRQPK